MGLTGWFPFLRKKGYNPMALYQSSISTIATGRRRRLDVLSTCYRVIRDAYTNHAPDVAHRILEKDIMRFGTTLDMTIYIDGFQAVEKSGTSAFREQTRLQALQRTSTALDTFESRLNSQQRIRKQHFTNIRTGLASSFNWSLESRLLFVRFMESRGWSVKFVETEADVAIAKDSTPQDVIISADSDMLGYTTIHTLWRPVSRGVILQYSLAVLLPTLGLSRAQLTALAVVSRNDYNRNIHSLGPATNSSVVKSIDHPDLRVIVGRYLSDKRVISKNTSSEDFALSIRVFVDMTQTRAGFRADAQVVYKQLQVRFKELCSRHEHAKRIRKDRGEAGRSGDALVRLHVPKSFNRYRTVESPVYTSENSGAPSQQISQANQDGTSSTPSEPKDSSHPALARTRIPRHRPRFSFKRQNGTMDHPPPPKAKQLRWKPPKEPCQPPNDPSASTTGSQKDAKAKKMDAPLSDGPTRSYAEMDKRGLLRSLDWHHPISSLEIGTLEANAKRVVSEDPRVQEEVVKCIREASEVAVDVKRMAQRLIGRFLETLQIRMRSAEESRRRDRARNGVRMSEADRQEARYNAVTEDERESLDFLCGRIAPKAEFDQDDGGSSNVVLLDAEDEGSRHYQFILCLLTYLYSNNLPDRNSKSGKAVDTFIHILVRLELFDIVRERNEINRRFVFTPNVLVRSVAGQLTAELARMYKNGTYSLSEQAKALQKKGLLPGDLDIRIRETISAAENYVALNELIPNKRRIAPFTSMQQPFVSFTERELAIFFWKRSALRQRLVDLALADEDSTTVTSQPDLEAWMRFKEPGFIIKHFIADIDPAGISNRQRRRAGHRGVIKLYPLEKIRDHLQYVKETPPKDDRSRGYIATGSVVTDGFRVKLQAYKLRERQDARYKRVSEQDLPPRLTSTVAGLDYYLSEIRHVFETEEDIHKIWPGKDMDRIKVLTIDAGKACVVGAFAHLPQDPGGSNKEQAAKAGSGTKATILTDQLPPSSLVPVPSIPAPLVPAPSMPAPLVPVPSMPAPLVPVPSIPAPLVPAPSTPIPLVPVPSIPAPLMPAPSILAPLVPAPSIPAPLMPAPSTPVPLVPVPSIPAPLMPVPLIPAPLVPAPSILAPLVPAPSTPAPLMPVSSTPDPSTPDPSTPDSSTPAYNNLAVKAKAVYQPQFRFRRWLEAEKMSRPEGEEESVLDIESRLPPLRGESASVINYIDELERVEGRLKAFYTGNGDRYRRHKWDMQRARQEEFKAIAESLLNIVGGSLGRRVDESPDADPVLIGIGLSKFSCKVGLSSLDSSFLTYFIRTVRSLGYVVVGLNEFYTSKKCPRCEQFVAQVTFRSLYCFPCKRYYHRDSMAAENMSKIVLERLQNQERPTYLQPVNADGSYPWKTASAASPNTTTSTGSTSARGSTSSTTATGSTGSTRQTLKRRSETVAKKEEGGRSSKTARA